MGFSNIFGVVIALLVIVVGSAGAANEITIEASLDLAGIGLVYRDISIQTFHDYEGVKFDEYLGTKSLGLYGDSRVNISEEIYVEGSNESSIEIVGANIIYNTKQKTCLRNYEVGSRHYYLVDGASINDYEYFGDTDLSSQIITSYVDGLGHLSDIVKNTTTHYTLYSEDIEYEGEFVIDYDILVEIPDYPAGEEEDWLGCP
jgi:hypothetical protein